MTREEKKFARAYLDEHCACPKCNSVEITQTLMSSSYPLEAPDTFVDINRAWCEKCEWEGIVHDLVRKKENV